MTDKYPPGSSSGSPFSPPTQRYCSVCGGFHESTTGVCLGPPTSTTAAGPAVSNVVSEPASDAAKGADEAPLTPAFIAELRRRLRKYQSNEHFVRVGPRDSALLVGELDALCEMAAAHEETKRALAEARQLQRKSVELIADIGARLGKAERARDDAYETLTWLFDSLVAARDAIAALQGEASWLPEQQAHATTMSEAERRCAKAVTDIDSILASTRPDYEAARGALAVKEPTT